MPSSLLMIERAAAAYSGGLWPQAEELCRGILALDNASYDALELLGVIVAQSGRTAEGADLLSRAVAVRPTDPQAHFNLGNALHALGHPDSALHCFDRALAIDPHFAEVHVNRGNALRDLSSLDEALESCRRALSLNPNLPEAHNACGIVAYDRNQPEAAVGHYSRAIALREDFVLARQNRAYAWLKAGDFANGWLEHEWRRKNRVLSGDFRHEEKLLWSGRESLAGRTILLHSEQGLGDTLQFCRYAPIIADLGARVVVEVPAELATLLSSLRGVHQVVARGERLPPFDFHCALMSLPLAFDTTLKTIPAQVPYLRADPIKVRHWKGKLGAPEKFRVGLVWSGGLRSNQPELWSINRRRNVPLSALAELADSGIEFYSVQKGQPGQSELTELVARSWPGPRLVDYTDALRDFSDTAAMVEHLDLLISADTSTAHLAGALGKPVWIMDRFDSCWRWLTNRSDSPWYPTARLYRQPRAGDWGSVVRAIKSDLQVFAREARHRQRAC